MCLLGAIELIKLCCFSVKLLGRFLFKGTNLHFHYAAKWLVIYTLLEPGYLNVRLHTFTFRFQITRDFKKLHKCFADEEMPPEPQSVC